MLAYAVGADHPLAVPSRRIVDAIRDRRITATTSVEAIQEFAHVRSRRGPRAAAASLARDYTELLAPLIVIDEKDLDEGLRLFVEHPRVGAFDCVLAAAAIHRGADALVSGDAGFRELPRLRFVGLEDPALNDLIAT